MNKLNRPVVLIAYHAHCIDGFTSAYVTSLHCAEKNKPFILLPMKYNKESEAELITTLARNCNVTELFVVDFSLSLDLLKQLGESFTNLHTVILDHHKTAFEKYAPIQILDKYSRAKLNLHSAHIELDMLESGASLCWKYFFPTEDLPLLIKYVRDYDLWQFHLGEDTRRVNAVLKVMNRTLTTWDNMMKGFRQPDYLATVIKDGEELLVKHRRQVNIIAGQAEPVVFEGYDCLVVSCDPAMTSDVGHALAKKCGTFGIVTSIDIMAKEVRYSLRSMEESGFDVSEIAKMHGGGGHKNAAGFSKPLLVDSIRGRV